MSDVKLFRLRESAVDALSGSAVALERSLQTLFERHLESLLGVRLLASEFATSHGGRMDTLGLDENSCPVIIEYKRERNENVINQGLFYLDWLMDHRKDFEWLVMDRLGREAADAVEWSEPRLICIAGDFTRYDEHAVKQMNRNIELIRYRRFGEDLLFLDLLTAASKGDGSVVKAASGNGEGRRSTQKTVTQLIADADRELGNRFQTLSAFIETLGDDVQQKVLKHYVAYRRIKNFACIEVKPQARKILVYLKVDPDSVDIEAGFTRDVRQIGHFGTGDLEITIASDDDFLRARPMIEQSYEAS